MNGFGNNYQPTGFSGKDYGNNYNQSLYNSQVGTMNPQPINIGFVQGKMGAGTYPIMSSNTTVYLFDVQDQTKFYVKATDAFGMALPLREFEYHEIVTQPQVAPLMIPSATKEITTNDTNGVTKEEFEELKAQLAALIQQNSKRPNQPKPRKERQEDV